jgi:hypothetical protein
VTVYVLIANSRSEMAEVVGVFASHEAAIACVDRIESTHMKPRARLEWTYTPADQDADERERWEAPFGVVDQYEVHALDVRDE